MSYILDALRRADSERERGAVPGIHAQPVPLHWRDAARARRAKPWLGALIGLSVVVLGAFGWQLLTREAPQNVAPSAAPPTPTPIGAAPPVVPSVPAAPAPPVAQNPTAAAPTPAPPVAVAPPSPAPKVAQQRPAPAPSAEPARRKTAPSVAAPATIAQPPAPRAAANATAADSGARIHTLSELPPEIRNQLPTLAIGGSMYSENAASRMLIVNGQLVHEGDTVAPGVSLEQIKLRSAVLRFKGYRYEITY